MQLVERRGLRVLLVEQPLREQGNRVTLVPPLLLLGVATSLNAAPDFNRDIQPIFEAHCLKCHGPDEQNGGLRYDRKSGALTQADSGRHALVPGKPEQSGLLDRITSTHKSERMPPKGERLSPQQIALLRDWIAAGAPWPEEPIAVAETQPSSTHWAFQPVAEPPIPEVRDKTWPPGRAAPRAGAGCRAATRRRGAGG